MMKAASKRQGKGARKHIISNGRKNSHCVQCTQINHFLKVDEWKIKFCSKNICAALILSFFINCYDFKTRKYAQQYSTLIAEKKGSKSLSSNGAFFYFNIDELRKAFWNIYDEEEINKALILLATLPENSSSKVIAINKSPNLVLNKAQGIEFHFLPDVCNDWIRDHFCKRRNKIKFNDSINFQMNIHSKVFKNANGERRTMCKSSVKRKAVTNSKLYKHNINIIFGRK